MKCVLSLAAFAGLALAQSVAIGLPKAGQKVSAGEDLIVQIQRPDTLTGSKEVAVSIGFTSCVESGCFPAKEELGTPVYTGKFNPQFHESGPPPYENFTVKVPKDFKAGKAQVNIAHFALVGASYFPMMEAHNQTIIVS